MRTYILLSLLILFGVGKATAKMDYPRLEKDFYLSPDKDKILKECKYYLHEMDRVLQDTARYNEAKREKIRRLQRQLVATKNYSAQVMLLLDLQQEYAILNLPISLEYAVKAKHLALQQNDFSTFYRATIKEAALLVKGGYFRQSAALLEHIPKEKLNDTLLAQYYETLFDLNFEDGFVFPGEKNEHDTFSKAMMAVYLETKKRFPHHRLLLTKMQTEYYFHIGDYKRAVNYALKLITLISPGTEDYAYHLGNVGYTSMGAGYYAQAIKYMAQSTEQQVKLGSSEYPTMRKLSEICTIMGLHKEAFKYSAIGMENAKRYESLYRIYEVSQFYPMIHDNIIKTLTRQHNRLVVIVLILILMIISFIVSIIIIRKKSTDLKRQNVIIADINHRLHEANSITIAVLGNLISNQSAQREKENEFYKNVARRISVGEYNGAKDLLKNKSSKKSKDAYVLLDGIILELFPDFVTQFYNLLLPQRRPDNIKTDRLTPEMRIFGLIRLGINNNSQLAATLNYSVNTIKHYKTIVFNQSSLSNEEFYKRLMLIQYKSNE